MRARPTLLALASALALVFSVPGSAHAAPQTGISFSYHDKDGNHSTNIQERDLNECVFLDILGAESTNYGFSPENVGTQTYADLYPDDDCKEAKLVTLKPGESEGEDLHFRSVLFRPMPT
ncbi:hypothetical protein [Streptomyces sp. XH2]|uniref:hypothetical protein n=1 Tax=Streptomyces sp. XH2 TaxID=3412483 RepID=UPI003C7EA08F